MFWLQVVVAMGVVLATVLVAGGRGDGLGALQPERASPLPVEGPVRREDVDAVRLGVGFRGYRMDEVDAVLDRLGDELARRDDELAALREPTRG